MIEYVPLYLYDRTCSHLIEHVLVNQIRSHARKRQGGEGVGHRGLDAASDTLV